MTLTRPRLIAFAGAGSAALLFGAFAFQFAGYAPCELCVIQRWPHGIAIMVALAALLSGSRRGWALHGAGLLAIGTALAAYHSGVEFGWWAGPASCTGGLGDIGAISVDDLMQKIRTAEVIRCDQPAVLIFGLSMAVWNTLASAALTLVWLDAWRRPA